VCHTPELQFYTTQRLYSALSSDLSQDSLTLASVWIIGEFADVLLQGGTIDDGEEVKQVRGEGVPSLPTLCTLGRRVPAVSSTQSLTPSRPFVILMKVARTPLPRTTAPTPDPR
jgi:hypothetical protein